MTKTTTFDDLLNGMFAGTVGTANIASLSYWYDKNQHSTTVNIDNDLVVSGDLIVNGQSLSSRLELIEKVLKIPTRRIDLEQQYPTLANLYQEYMHEVEKLDMHEVEKLDMLEKLKGNTDE